MEELKALHDRMLAEQPEGASHDAATCGLCTPGLLETASTTLTGGSVSEKTRTEDEYNKLVSEVEALKAQVAEYSATANEAEVDAKVSAATAELEQQVAALQAQLDTAVAEAETSKQQHEALVAFLEAEQAAQAEAAALEARKAERIEAVKEAAPFTDDYIAENADRWAGLSDDEFAAAINDWKAVAAKAAAAVTEKADDDKDDIVPAETAMKASADKGSNPLVEVMDLRFTGQDIRNI